MYWLKSNSPYYYCQSHYQVLYYYIYGPKMAARAVLLITNDTIRHNSRNIFFPSTQNRMFLFHVEFSVGLAIKKLRPSRWTNNRRLSNIPYVPSPHHGLSNDNWQPISSWTRFYLKNTLSNLSAGVSKCSLQMIGLS